MIARKMPKLNSDVIFARAACSFQNTLIAA